MRQLEISRWLKSITLAAGLAGAVFFFFFVPLLAGEMKREYPEAGFLYWPGLACNLITAAVCYGILFQFWTVCREIGRDNSFSKENAQAFKRISRLAVLLAGVFAAGSAGLVIFRCVQIGIMLFLIAAIFISFAAAVLTAALSHLIWKAYEMKRENELTI